MKKRVISLLLALVNVIPSNSPDFRLNCSRSSL